MFNGLQFTILFAFILTLGSAPMTAQENSLDDPSSLTKYVTVKLEADFSHLSDNQRKMIPLLIEAAEQMDIAFWKQAYGNRKKLKMPEGVDVNVAKALMKHAEINYGPWERLQENRPFISGVEAKPLGAGFYPRRMKKEQLESQVSENPDL